MGTCCLVPRAALKCHYLPCGPETRGTRSVGILDVSRRVFAYSRDAIRVRVMTRYTAAFAGICDPVVIPGPALL